MSLEQNKQLAMRFEEELHNQKKLEVIDEIVAPEYTDHGPSGSRTFTREELKDLFRSLFASVPDLHDEVHDVIAEGDRVALRMTRSGTFTGTAGDTEATANTPLVIDHSDTIMIGYGTHLTPLLADATSYTRIGIDRGVIIALRDGVFNPPIPDSP